MVKELTYDIFGGRKAAACASRANLERVLNSKIKDGTIGDVEKTLQQESINLKPNSCRPYIGTKRTQVPAMVEITDRYSPYSSNYMGPLDNLSEMFTESMTDVFRLLQSLHVMRGCFYWPRRIFFERKRPYFHYANNLLGALVNNAPFNQLGFRHIRIMEFVRGCSSDVCLSRLAVLKGKHDIVLDYVVIHIDSSAGMPDPFTPKFREKFELMFGHIVEDAEGARYANKCLSVTMTDFLSQRYTLGRFDLILGQYVLNEIQSSVPDFLDYLKPDRRAVFSITAPEIYYDSDKASVNGFTNAMISHKYGSIVHHLVDLYTGNTFVENEIDMEAFAKRVVSYGGLMSYLHGPNAMDPFVVPSMWENSENNCSTHVVVIINPPNDFRDAYPENKISKLELNGITGAVSHMKNFPSLNGGRHMNAMDLKYIFRRGGLIYYAQKMDGVGMHLVLSSDKSFFLHKDKCLFVDFKLSVPFTFVFQCEILDGKFLVTEFLSLTDHIANKSYNYVPFVVRLQLMRNFFHDNVINDYAILYDPVALTQIDPSVEGFMIQNGLSPTHIVLPGGHFVGTAVRLKRKMDVTIKKDGRCYDFMIVDERGTACFEYVRDRDDKQQSSMSSPCEFIMCDYEEIVLGSYVKKLDPVYALLPKFPIFEKMEIDFKARWKHSVSYPKQNPLLETLGRNMCPVYPCSCKWCTMCSLPISQFMEQFFYALFAKVEKLRPISKAIKRTNNASDWNYPFTIDISDWLTVMFEFGLTTVDYTLFYWDKFVKPCRDKGYYVVDPAVNFIRSAPSEKEFIFIKEDHDKLANILDRKFVPPDQNLPDW